MQVSLKMHLQESGGVFEYLLNPRVSLLGTSLEQSLDFVI
jgi:hypothetical protein